MTFRPHSKQAEFMREPPNRLIMAGVSRGGAGRPSGSWSADAFAHDAEVLCQRRVGYIIQAPEGANGIDGIDMHGTRPCGGRLIDGKCEFCDVTTIEARSLDGGSTS